MNQEELTRLLRLSNIEIYEQVLQRKIPCFPSGFWINQSKEEGKKIAVELLRYLLDTKYKWSREEILTNVSREFIMNNKLWTPFKLYFGRAVNQFCIAAYPGSFMPFEFRNCKVGHGYWKVESNRINALKWLFEKKLKWNFKDIGEKFNIDVLNDNGLATLRAYYPSLFEVIKAVYPGKIQPWELQQGVAPKGTWDDKNNRINAVKWLISSLGWNHNEVVLNINESIFTRYGLCGLLEFYYSGNPVKAILEAFPDEYFPWEFDKSTHNIWDKESAIKATRWLFNKKLKYSREDIIKNASCSLFEEYNLRGMIDKIYNGSASLAVADAFEDIKVWEMPIVPKRYWNKDNAAESVKWLISEKLRWDEDMINTHLTAKVFKDFGLERMLQKCFFGSPYLAIKYAFPKGNWCKLETKYLAI